MKLPNVLLSMIFGFGCLAAVASEMVIQPEPTRGFVDQLIGDTAIPVMRFIGESGQVFYVPVNGDDGNWQDKTEVSFELYSPEETTAEALVFLRNSDDGKPLDQFPRMYHWAKFPVNWKGWKTVTLALSDFSPSTGSIEEGARAVPPGVSQIGFANQIGPDDPAENPWGIPVAKEFSLGLGKITLRE